MDQLRIYTLRTAEALEDYATTRWPSHIRSLRAFGVTTRGIWTNHDVDAHRLAALISYPEGADPGEITTAYMASAEFAADMRGFDVTSIVKVEELLLDPAFDSKAIQPYEPGADMPGADMPGPRVPESWRVLGFGKHPENAAAIQAGLRDAGLAATNFALTDDEAGDARLIRELTAADYDGVMIGGFINGQDPEDPPTELRTRWFNRILNIVRAHAPTAKIILVRNPADALPAIRRVLGDSAPEPQP